MVNITTYKEIHQYVDFFVKGKTNLMIIEGGAGIGKTEEVKRALAKADVVHHYQEGYITKTQFIKVLYEHRDNPIVIDDTDNLFTDKGVFGVLREAFDTRPNRTVSYASPSPFIQDIPASFAIQSPLLIITNGIKDSPAVKAFRSRAVCVTFSPSPEEVSQKLRTIAKASSAIPEDEEVLAMFQRLAPISKQANFRAYILSANLKPEGIDWKKHLVETMHVRPELGFAVEATESARSFKERSQKFRELTGKSERTYSRLLKEYREVVK